MAHNDDDGMIWAGTNGSDDDYKNDEGLVNGHAYVVQHVAETSDGLKMVRLRNPWGKDSYHGKYSDHSTASADWTPELRTELNYSPDEHDGVIWMEYDYYLKEVSFTMIGEDTDGWFNSAYLKLDDNSLENDSSYAGEFSWCGQDCTRHRMNVKSTVKQQVYLSGHTWDNKVYPQTGACLYALQYVHSMNVPHDRVVRAWTHG